MMPDQLSDTRATGQKQRLITALLLGAIGCMQVAQVLLADFWDIQHRLGSSMKRITPDQCAAILSEQNCALRITLCAF